MAKLLHQEITEIILSAYYEVYNVLGYGFLEKVYQNALFFELQNRGLKVEAQKKILVYYKNKLVGEFYTDILVNDLVIVELKAIEYLIQENEFQTLNYLKASNIEVGLLLNFGKKPEFKRVIFTNDNKNFSLKNP